MNGWIYPWAAWLLAAGVLAAVLSIVYISWRNGITPMPSSAPVRRAVAAEVRRIAARGSLLEAGSGWGTLAFHMAAGCPGWRITGVENSPVPLWVSQLRARLQSCSRVRFQRGDIYSCAYQDYDLVVCYLYPGAMARLGPILRRQLPPGARVISICFAVPDWEPERVMVCRDLYRTRVYVYTQGVS